MSLKNQLYEYLKRKSAYTHGAELEDYGRSLGFKADNVSRRLRELRKAGSVESQLRLHDGVKIAWWRIKETRPPQVLEQYRKEIISVTQPLFTRAQM